MQWVYRLSTGLPPSSRLYWLWNRKEDLQRAWNQDRRDVWDQVGLSHCWHEGLVMIRDEARLRWGHNEQSRRGHQCSETTLTGESWFHVSTPMEIEPQVPHGRKQTGSPVDQWDMVWMQWDCRLSRGPWFCSRNSKIVLQADFHYLALVPGCLGNHCGIQNFNSPNFSLIVKVSGDFKNGSVKLAMRNDLVSFFGCQNLISSCRTAKFGQLCLNRKIKCNLP